MYKVGVQYSSWIGLDRIDMVRIGLDMDLIERDRFYDGLMVVRVRWL